MMPSNVHLLIIWSKGLYQKDYVIDSLASSFKIIRIFRIHWDSESFFDNYKTFYAHSLKHLYPRQFSNVINNKIEHCGKGDFIAVIFEDEHPNMQERETSSGKRVVNINVFDKKTEYRKITGGGHRIHSSDDAWETNKDLTLLFGLNTADFCSHYSKSETKEIQISRNCVGVGGYASIQQLFYVLNNTIKYCVLRNYECLPDEYTVEGHGDIDLLVEDRNYMFYLTLAKRVFPESYRVYHTIKIAGEEVPFDFRYVGDNYYDQPWEEHILANRQLKNNLFFIPNAEDQYYTLLYHAYIQKWEVKEDYLLKLAHYATVVNEVFKPEVKLSINQIDSYLEKNSFEYIRPKDISVVYNKKNLQLSNYALRYGDFVKRVNEFGNNGYAYTSLVYRKENSYIKRGTRWLIDNEVRFLTMLTPSLFFPQVINHIKHKDESLIEISKVEGVQSFFYFRKTNHQRRKFITSFLEESLNILMILNQKGIFHRDFLPSNLIVKEERGKSKVGLIDFGWAIYVSDKDVKTPHFLGGNYKPQNGYSDLYTFGKMLMEMWYDVPYIKRFAHLLMREAYDMSSQSLVLIKAKRFLKYYPFTPYDEARLFIRRHQKIKVFKDKARRLFKF